MYRHPARIRPLTAMLAMAIAGVPALWVANSANAGGFALIEHGASGLGNAYAGAAAVSIDGSTVWFNPAGMSELDGRTTAFALHALSTDTEWRDEGTALGFRLGGGEVSGPDTASPGTATALPNFYYVSPIDEQWSYGLSIGVPFGSSTEYDSNWKGRYTTVKSGINVIDINPALSYQVSDTIRLGFGISVQQLSAELGQSVDSGAVCLSLANNPNVPTGFSTADCLNAGLAPGNFENDSTTELTGDSIGYGFNLGALFLPTEGVKLGVAYRHSVDHELNGDVDFGINPALRTLLNENSVAATQPLTSTFLTDGTATTEVNLPAMLSISGSWQATDKIELLSDLTWTGWSTFEEIRIQFDTENPLQADSVSLQEWEDVLRFSAGLNYRYNPKTILRAGYAFDEEAIPSAQRRTARIPGNDRTWFSFGLGYKVNQNFSFDVGYARLVLDETPIDNANSEAGPGTGTFVRGVFDPSVDILSAQINWDFN